MIGLQKAMEYCRNAENDKRCGKYIKKQCAEWLEIAEDRNEKYTINLETVEYIHKVLKHAIFATGKSNNTTYLESLKPFQWLFLLSALCTVDRETREFKYRKIVIEMARKSGKNSIVSLYFLLRMMMSAKYAEYYSVSSDKAFASRTFDDLSILIENSPRLTKYFNVKKSYIEHRKNKSKFVALAYGRDKGNSIQASAYVADEVATLPTNDILVNMAQSQKSVRNPQGVFISTRYPADDIFNDELEACRSVLEGEKANDKLFALLYEPDEEIRGEYIDNDLVLAQANPLALEVSSLWEDALLEREQVKVMPSYLNNYLTKICNIPVKNRSDDPYLIMDYWERCRVELDDIVWSSPVCIGIDMSLTTDLTGISIVMEEDGKFYTKSFGFLPRESLKNRREKLDYNLYDGTYCFINEGSVIKYEFIYDFIIRLSKQMTISKICYDPYNANLLAEKLSSHFDMEVVKQNYSTMSPLVKQFREFVYIGGIIYYEENPILDYCVSCAVTTMDKSMNEMLDKAKSMKNRGGRIDLLMSTLYAFYGCRREGVLDWIAQ